MVLVLSPASVSGWYNAFDCCSIVVRLHLDHFLLLAVISACFPARPPHTLRNDLPPAGGLLRVAGAVQPFDLILKLLVFEFDFVSPLLEQHDLLLVLWAIGAAVVELQGSVVFADLGELGFVLSVVCILDELLCVAVPLHLLGWVSYNYCALISF